MGECQEVLAGYKDNAKDREKDVVKEAKPEVICYPPPLLFTSPPTWADFKAQRPKHWWHS